MFPFTRLFFMNMFYLGDRRAIIDLFFWEITAGRSYTIADPKGKELEIMSWHMVFGRYMNCYGALAELEHNNP